jgi:hypothetical protein
MNSPTNAAPSTIVDTTASPRFRRVLAFFAALAIVALHPLHDVGEVLSLLTTGVLAVAAALVAYRYATLVLALMVTLFPAILFIVGLVGLLVR